MSGGVTHGLRAVVAELRMPGWPICPGTDGRGYQLSWDPADLDALERKYRRQALAELRTLRRIKRMRQHVAA